MTRSLAHDADVEELLRAFADLSLPRAEWTHEAHLAVALWYLRHCPLPEALDRVREGICRYNARHGASAGYHETLTVFYMHLVAAWAAAHPRPAGIAADLAALVADLGARNLPARFYSSGRLATDAARAGWVAPDLRPLPPVAHAAVADLGVFAEPSPAEAGTPCTAEPAGSAA